MRIVFLLERPSQFDAPLFRLAAADPEHLFEAWFLDPRPDAPVHDPELERAVDWEESLVGGYEHRVVPAQGAARWFAERLGDAREQIDLLIVNGYTRRAYQIAAAAARSSGIATALRIDSVRFPSDRAPSLLRRVVVGRLLSRRFDRFLTTGSLGERFLRDCGVASSSIGRFSYAVDHERFARLASAARRERARLRVELEVPADATLVLSLTKFVRREAPWDIHAARSVDTDSQLFWLLAGDGPLRVEMEARARVIASKRVAFPGYIPYSRLPELYAAADLFVHPAREERWGVSIAEALASGLPVVASDRVGAAYDLVLPGMNGDRYSAGNGAELYEAIRRSLSLARVDVAAASVQRLAEYGLESTWNALVETAALIASRRQVSA